MDNLVPLMATTNLNSNVPLLVTTNSNGNQSETTNAVTTTTQERKRKELAFKKIADLKVRVVLEMFDKRNGISKCTNCEVCYWFPYKLPHRHRLSCATTCCDTCASTLGACPTCGQVVNEWVLDSSLKKVNDVIDHISATASRKAVHKKFYYSPTSPVLSETESEN